MATSRLERIGTIFTRKKGNTNLLRCLSEVVSQLEADHEILKDNEHKLEHVTGVLVKCVKQATIAQKQKLRALKVICTTYEKECEVMEKNHKAEAEKLANEMEENMSKLQQKLIAETKRKQMENLRRTILQFQNDF